MSTHIATPQVTTTTAVPQYSRARILATWAAAALPMATAAWVGAPLLAEVLDGPTALPRALIVMLTAALAWQFGFVMFVVRREQGSLRWSTVKDALWLHRPTSPRSGRRGGRVWLVTIPLILALAAEEMIPSLPHPVGRDLALFFDSDTGRDFMSGNWVWLAVLVVMWTLNTALGEELLFRGLLLPRMNGAFGRGDWAVNGVLFALYHLHVPWVIPQALMDAFILAYPSKRYRSALLGIVVHSAQSVVFLMIGLALVLQ